MSTALLITASLLVKSGLIVLAGLICARFLARQPSEKVVILRAVVIALLLLPLATMLMPSIRLALLPQQAAAPLAVAVPLAQAQMDLGAGTAVAMKLQWPGADFLMCLLWGAVAVLLVVRLVHGLLTLFRWTREGTPVSSQAWLKALKQQAPGQRPRLLLSDRTPGPLSWGMAPGTILLDRASLADLPAAPAVLAHELAHLRRRDWVFLLLSQLALAAYWFNPLVWKLHHDLTHASELAADEAAVASVDRETYARTLVRLAAVPAPDNGYRSARQIANAMAADPAHLNRRILSIMTRNRLHARPAITLAGLVALIGTATPLAALELVAKPAAPALAEVAAPVVADVATAAIDAETAAPVQASAPQSAALRADTVRSIAITDDGSDRSQTITITGSDGTTREVRIDRSNVNVTSSQAFTVKRANGEDGPVVSITTPDGQTRFVPATPVMLDHGSEFGELRSGTNYVYLVPTRGVAPEPPVPPEAPERPVFDVPGAPPAPPTPPEPPRRSVFIRVN